MDVLTIISVVLGAVAVIASGFWLKAKGKLAAVKKLAKESYDLVSVAIAAVDDNAIDKAEIDAIKKEAVEVLAAWKALIGKV